MTGNHGDVNESQDQRMPPWTPAQAHRETASEPDQTRDVMLFQGQVINLTPGKVEKAIVPAIVTPEIDLTRQAELRARVIRDLANTDPKRAYLQGLAYLEEGMALRESAHELIIPVIEECSKVPGFEKLRKADMSRWIQAEGIKREYEDMTRKIEKAWEVVEKNWGSEITSTLRPLAKHYAYAAACRKMSRTNSWETIRDCSHWCTLRRLQGARKSVENQYYRTVAMDIQNAEKVCRLEGKQPPVGDKELHAWRLYQQDNGLLAQMTKFHSHLIQAKEDAVEQSPTTENRVEEIEETDGEEVVGTERFTSVN